MRSRSRPAPVEQFRAPPAMAGICCLSVMGDWHPTNSTAFSAPPALPDTTFRDVGSIEIDDQKRSQRSSPAGDPLPGTPTSLRAAAGTPARRLARRAPTVLGSRYAGASGGSHQSGAKGRQPSGIPTGNPAHARKNACSGRQPSQHPRHTARMPARLLQPG